MSMMRHAQRFTVAVALLSTVLLSQGQASAQNRDSLLNGALIGGAIGAGIGIAFTHAVRDSDLTAGQYASGGLVFGAIGAGAGLGVDALLNRSPRPAVGRSGLFIAPAVGRVKGVAVMYSFRLSPPAQDHPRLHGQQSDHDLRHDVPDRRGDRMRSRQRDRIEPER